MPRETAIIIAAICVPFVVFALVLAWGDYWTRGKDKFG
jgi:uncharacterized membrane protein YozB (DUF420 family)